MLSEPRVKSSAAACRAGISSASNPLGTRTRTSRFLPLTLFVSQTHENGSRPSTRPSERANPVMLMTAADDIQNPLDSPVISGGHSIA